MKKLFTVLKFTLLAALLIGLAFAYLFFRIWQKNERPVLLDQGWSSSEILIGHSSTLTFRIEAPWHREIVNGTPFSHPDFLPPVPDQATVTRGDLSPTGTRVWTITVPFVATDTKEVDGLTASFSLKKTERISPTSVDVPLPPLKILNPTEIPDSPDGPDTFLTEAKPPDEPAEEVGTTDTEPRPLLWITLGCIALTILIFLLKKSGIIKTTPPWEKALAHLSKLDPTTPPAPFYSKLTDILKQYTADRFKVRARSKTTAEFITVLRNHPRIPKEHLDELTTFAHLADEVKFADLLPESERASQSLDLIRGFVTETTPEVDSGKGSNSKSPGSGD